MQHREYRVAFRGKAACDRMVGFRFDKPDGYTFQAGQYLALTLETRDGQQTKSFSHASSPADASLSIATRMTGSAFKDALGDLGRGEEVAVSGPYGSLILPADAEKVVFLAGGVGITPCRSMIRDSQQHRRHVSMVLFYGNHDQLCIPYSSEFEEYQSRSDLFEVVQVLEDPLPGWQGERGLVTADLVRRHLSDPADWLYVIAGPPAMVTAMLSVAEGLELPSDRLLVERFTGHED